MKEIRGVISELGDSVTKGLLNLGSQNSPSNTFTTFSYIEIGGQTVRKIRAFSGVSGKLQMALQNGDDVTLFLKHRIVCGIRFSNGKTFSSRVGPNAVFLIILFAVLVVSGVPLIALFGLGLIVLWFAWSLWKVLSAKFAARSIPNAISI